MWSSPVVYLDVVLVINWLLDYLLLWSTARFAQLNTNPRRLSLSSTCGALYALAPLLCGQSIAFSVGSRIAFSLLMVWLAYSDLTVQTFVQAVIYFYLVAFVMAGAVLGAAYLFHASLDAYDLLSGLLAFLDHLPYGWLLAAAAAAVLLARWGAPALRKSFLNTFFRVPVVIRFGEKNLAVYALVDTGNQLRDPLTQRPVIIVEYEVLQPLLPAAVRQSLRSGEEPDLRRLTEDLRGTPWAARFHLVPFTSIGRTRGMLLCFRPDEVVVVTRDRMVKVKDILVGIYHRRLSPQGNYRALLHPDVLQMAI